MNRSRIRNYCRGALAVLALTPLAALAAGSATINFSGETGQIHWQDANTVRMDMEDEGHLLLKNQRLYAINTAADDMPPVMDMTDMKEMITGLVEGEHDALSDLTAKIKSVRKTGANRTLAGIRGEVYEITVVTGHGETETHEAVLTSDPIVTELTEAYFGVMGTFTGVEHLDKLKAALPAGKQGILQLSDSFEVQSLERTAPAGAFELPAEPVSFGGMMQDMMKEAMEQLKKLE